MALQLSQLLDVGYMEAVNMITAEVGRSGDKFFDAALRLIEEARQGQSE
jgi:hypothetical protein